LTINRFKRKQGSQPEKGKKVESKKIILSYLHIDRAQGQTLEIWDKKEGRLLRWENMIQHLNTLTVQQALLSRVIVKYDDRDVLDVHNMPKKSNWKYPKHLGHKDIIWCKIVVMQLVRVIGFMEENIFYVVFFDEKHEFYPTEPKNT
jgi:hypothetical protein